ncbi:MAG: cytochrome c family protein [bacterium]
MKKLFLLIFPIIALILLVVFQKHVPSQGNEYQSAEQCKMCHAEKHKKWETTRMAKAYDLLVAAGQENNKECYPCHTTGYGKGGFTDPQATPNLKGVQCEACHGAGGNHMGDPKGIIKTPPASVCAECHKNSLH